MPTRIGINGFGRMGRLAVRAGWGRPDLQVVHVNEVAGGPKTAAHLLTFDSVHVDGTCVKVLAWYDSEIGYVHRMIELAQKVGASL